MITKADVKHSGDTASRHYFIWFSIRLDGLDIKEEVPENKLKLPDWSRAKTENIYNYTSSLHEGLSAFNPEPAITCKVINCDNKDLIKAAESRLLDVITVIIECGYSTIPIKRKKLKGLPSWKTDIEPLRVASIKAHKEWLDSGKPTEGELHERMKTKKYLQQSC